MVQLREEEEERDAQAPTEDQAVEPTPAAEVTEEGQNTTSRTPAEPKSPTMPRIEEEEETAG